MAVTVSGLFEEMTSRKKKSRGAPLRLPSLILFSVLLDKVLTGGLREEMEKWIGERAVTFNFLCQSGTAVGRGMKFLGKTQKKVPIVKFSNCVTLKRSKFPCQPIATYRGIRAAKET